MVEYFAIDAPVVIVDPNKIGVSQYKIGLKDFNFSTSILGDTGV